MLRRRLLRRVLASGTREPGEGLGLGDDRLRDLAVEHRFGSLASFFPRVGGPLELREVAWWGSALADIGCAAAASRGRDEELLADAARFYLAVALFDDVVDGTPDRAGALAQPLEPDRLRRKLEHPTLPEARLHCAELDLGLIVALVDKALEGIGRRLDGEPARRAELAEMLEAMYRSELSLSGDPLAAKTLPFVLIGHLAAAPEDGAARSFFARFAELLGLWDDWQDLAADGGARAPNGHMVSALPPSRLRGLARGVWLTLMGMVPRHAVSRRLMRALEATLESSGRLPPAAGRKADALLLHMLGAGDRGLPVIARPRDARAPAASRERASGTARPQPPGSP